MHPRKVGATYVWMCNLRRYDCLSFNIGIMSAVLDIDLFACTLRKVFSKYYSIKLNCLKSGTKLMSINETEPEEIS